MEGVKTRALRLASRYDKGMSDLLFVALSLAFFVAAAAFVAGCERIVGSAHGEERPR